MRTPGCRLLAALLPALLVCQTAHAVIVITEIMYNPRGGGRDLEYIEIHNETPDPMDITGYYFCEGVSFTFTERTFLDPGAYIVVCANVDRVKTEYGITNAVGNWDPDTSLDNGGERISLCNPGGAVETTVRYNDRGKWPSGADGTGHSLEIVSPYVEVDDPDNWALSSVLGGSPGKANPPPATDPPVLINEALLLPPAGGERWVELYNHGSVAADVSGYQLGTDRAGQVVAPLPAGSVVPARGWISFTDTALGLGFSKDSSGRVFIALWTPDRSRVVDARDFEPKLEGATEARMPDGDSDFREAADPTRNAANKVTVNGDVVIDELMYHPIDDDPRREYVELYNRGTTAVDLTGWSFTDGIRYSFPQGTTLAPDSYLVVAPYPEDIREIYGLSASQVLGPEDDVARDAFGTLSNAGERVTLSDPKGNTADTVRYYDGGEWPEWADGGGSSLELVDPFQENSVAQAWDASDDSDKAVTKEYVYDGVYTSGEPEFHIVLPANGITLVDDLKMVTETTTVDVITPYVNPDDTFRYFKGFSEPSDPPTLWRQLDFDDSTWETGPGPIGFGEADEGTTLTDMRNAYTSFFVRKDFTVADPSAIESLILEMEYDDGYFAYLNGTEVASGNMEPGNTAYDATAKSSKERVFDRVDLTDRKALLVPGRNVLAVQVHNSSISSSDARFKASLVDGRFVVTEGPNLFKDGTFESDTYKTSWTIQGTHYRSGRTTEDPLDGTGSLKVMSTGGGDNKVNRIETSNSGFPTSLPANSQYRISFLARWVVGSQTLLTHGAYNSSASPSYATSHRLEYPEQLGTPGARNSVTARQIARTGSSNLGPVISKVNQDPALPAANQAVTVRAKVRDPDGVASVNLLYTLNTPVSASDPKLISLPMTGPDADGYYSCAVPGQTLRTRVVFYITATDSKGATGRYPVDHLNRTHPLILDPAAATPNDPLYLIYRHDNPVGGKPQSYRFWMHQANENYLSSRPLLSNDFVDGSFLFQNKTIYYNSKLRFSGSPWARQAWTESYRIRLPKDNHLHGRIEAFNMEDHQGSGGRDGKERTSHYMIRYNQGRTRVPYSLQWLVQLQVNDRVNEVREHTQTPNPEYIQRWFPSGDNGSFFEMDDRFVINDGGTRQDSMDGRLLYPPYGSVANGEDPEQYRYYFNLRLKNEQDDHRELIELAKLMTAAATPNEEFDARVWDLVDVEEFCRVWSIRMNTDDWDTWGTTRGKNCYLYKPSDGGPWNLIPWDMELTYADTGTFMPPAMTATSNPTYTPGSKFPEVTRFINRPRIKRMYYGILKEITDNQFSSTFLTPYMLKLDTVGVLNTAIGKAGGYIDQRRNALRNVIRGVTSPTIDMKVTTNGGAPLDSPTPSVAIDGQAPVEISLIVVRVNGSEENDFQVRFSDTSVLAWTATGTLPVGKSTLEFFGYNSLDELVDSVSYDVTVTPLAPPTITSITPDRVVAGEIMVITGTDFAAGLKVRFDDTEATQVEFDPAVDPTRIAVVVIDGLAVGPHEVRVVNLGDAESAPRSIDVLASKKRFIRGDVDLNLTVNLTDAVVTLDYLFKGGPGPSCLDAADTNDDGVLNLTDPIVTLQYLFQGGTPPAAPFPSAGEDPTTSDPLDCAIGLE